MEKQRAREAVSFDDGFRILQGRQEFITYTEHSSIRVWPSDTANHFDSHQHSAVEVILPDRGVSVYELPEETYRVKPGEILFVPPNCQHSLTEGGDTLRYLKTLAAIHRALAARADRVVEVVCGLPDVWKEAAP